MGLDTHIDKIMTVKRKEDLDVISELEKSIKRMQFFYNDLEAPTRAQSKKMVEHIDRCLQVLEELFYKRSKLGAYDLGVINERIIEFISLRSSYTLE